jgi:hypothetical protein
MGNHCLLEKKCLRLTLKYELDHCRMCIRVAALVYLNFGTSLILLRTYTLQSWGMPHVFGAYSLKKQLPKHTR